MEFRTKVAIPTVPFRISHQDKMLMIGSCFTENIGRYLHQYKFKINTNPFGIIYNPVSIINNLQRIIDCRFYSEEELLYSNELYLSLDHHGSFSGIDKMEVLDKINEEIEKGHHIFNESNYILLTFGTAFVYKHIGQHKIVANCHKISASEFEKRLLTIEEIVSSYEALQTVLNKKTIIFTTSPVRHWRDGAIENQRSKSILTESIHRIFSKQENVLYFPAFEIVMDELRDYRFYEEDMLHPNAVAIKYIWNRFSETYFSKETIQINKEIEKINLLMQHRIKKHHTKSETAFKEQIINSINVFKKNYPTVSIDFSASSGKIGNSI